jgi:hypothetical protein
MKIPLPLAFFLAFMFASASHASSLVAYNFDALDTGYLLGQDGWYLYEGDATNIVVGLAGNDFNTTMFLTRPAATGAAAVWRKKDAALNFLTPSGHETNYVLQFDVRVIGRAGSLGLGCSTNGALGPVFGYGRTGNFVVREANFGTPAVSPTYVVDGSWFRLRLHIDFTAYAGDGAGSLELMNLTAGETSFTADPALQRINLKILSQPGSPPPSAWDQAYVRIDSTCEVDNLFITANPPSPRLTISKVQGATSLSWASDTNYYYEVQSTTNLSTHS